MRRALIVVCAAALTIVPPAAAWTWPVKGPVLQKFVLGDDPYAAGQHRGIDIGAPAGATVFAPVSGTVSFAGTVPVSGRSVTIQTADGYSVTLTHLGLTSVGRGAKVTEGDTVGTIGPSGEVEHDVPYVHLGVRRSEDPNGYVDPLLFLPALTAPPVAPSPAPPAPPAPAPPPAAASPRAVTAPAPAASGPATPAAPVVMGSRPNARPRTATGTVAKANLRTSRAAGSRGGVSAVAVGFTPVDDSCTPWSPRR